jgi:hypothetical protein
MVPKNEHPFSKKTMRNAICPRFEQARQALACAKAACPAAFFTLS